MKPVFGIDITITKNNKFFDGREFVVATVSEERANALKQAKADIETLKSKANFSLPVRILHWICAAVALIATTMFFDNTTDHVGFKHAYYEKPLLFWLGIIGIIVWLVINIAYTSRINKTLKSEDGKQLISRVDIFEDSCYANLFVPSNAVNVDILSFTYKNKNGTPIAKNNSIRALTPHRNLKTKMFIKDKLLYIADTENKYAFPLSEMTNILTIKKSVKVLEWNKETPPTKGIYKSYKMDDFGTDGIRFKPYHILELEHNGEIWGIYFPCYELPVIEELTGLKAKQ